MIDRHARAIAIALAIAMLAVRIAAADPEPTRDYIVKPGDSCMAIAVRELGGQEGLAVIHRLNPWLGPTPHHLVPGTVLKLPLLKPVAPDARLTGQEGHVEVRRAGEEAWFQASTGADLFRAWRVGSHEESSAQIAFADRSTISMRENTVVIIYGATRAQAGVQRFAATLEKGALRSRLADLDGTATVATAGGDVVLGGGSAVVDVDASKTTRVSNHVGKPAKLVSKTAKPKAVVVDPGFGSRVAVGKDPAPPKPLPPPPVWQDVPAIALSPNGHGAVMTGAWAPVTAAASYRVELARDKELTSIALRAQVPASAARFEIQSVPPGDYYLAVAAIDADGFESKASEPRPVHVVALQLPAAAVVTPGVAPQVALGSVIVAPAGLACSTGAAGSAPSERVIVATSGALTLTCTGPDGGAGAFAFDVPAVKIAAAASQPIAAGQVGAIDIAIDAAQPPAGTIQATTSLAGATVESVAPTPTGVRVHVRAADSASGTGSLRLALVAAPDAAAIDLGDVPLAIAARSAEPIAPGQPGHGPAYALDVVGGGAFAKDARDGLAGMQVRIKPSPYVAAELGLRVGDPLLLQTGIALQLPSGPVTPALRLGFALRDQSGAHPGGYVGLSLAHHVAQQLSVVVDVDGLEIDRAELQVVGGLRVRL